MRLPGGNFLMGSNVRANEQPVHPVHVRSFDLAVTEVTVGQFRAFTASTGYVTDAERGGASSLATSWGFIPKIGVNWKNPGFLQGDDEPAVVLSWIDAVTFAEWLAAETGEQYRLPSEAEWEYACRADPIVDTTNALDQIAWFRANSGGHTHPVATKQPNVWGLYDLLGNAWEWCQDVYRVGYTNASVDGTPWMAPGEAVPGNSRVLRGGGWSLGAGKHPVSYDLLPTSRAPFGPDASCGNSGFRLARTIRPPQENPTPAGDQPLIHQVRGVRFELVLIPPGEFEMGSASDQTDKAAHIVRLKKPIRMGKTEVTVRQFRAFVSATGYVTDAERNGWAWDSNFHHQEWSRKKPGLTWTNIEPAQIDDDPVACVSWNDAAAFCRWLSKETGRRFRLPSEAEWEYACRANASAAEKQSLGDIAWYADNAERRLHPVATKKPNVFGIHDMLGNAAEWVEDLWYPAYDGAPTDGSSRLMVRTNLRVCRGGSIERRAQEFSATGRDWYDPSEAIASLGFRVVDATIGERRQE